MALSPLRSPWRPVQRPLMYRPNYASPQLKGLVGWWPLDRSVGVRNMVGPTSGSYAGTVAGNPLLGVCHDINDNTDSTLVTTYTAANDLTTLTLSAWFTIRSAGGGSVGRIFDKNALGFGFSVYNRATTIEFEYRKWATTNGEWSVPTIAYDATGLTPHHIALSYDATAGTAAQPVILIDGVLQTVTTIVTPAGTLTDSEVSDMRIGNRAALDRNWDGHLADIRLHNYAMTLAEMRVLQDPATRWEAYDTHPRRTILQIPAAVTGWGALVSDRRNRLVMA